MTKYHFLLVLSLISGIFVFGQKEAAIWYFGNDTCLRPPTNCQPSVYSRSGGLDFNSGLPVPTGTCSIAPDDAYAIIESVSTISDKNTGNLLFYSEGLNVFDRNHNVMPNGSGLIGSTGVSSTQGALIIPRPGSDSLYYLFTTGSHVDGFASGLRYSLIDMTLNSGLGDVVAGQKNILLAPLVTEKLSAAKHCNGSDVWVIAHELGTDGYLAYLLTPAGVNATPVKTNIGTVITSSAGVIGQMKASPNGFKLASALYINSSASKVELFDFNPSTGKLCNYIPFTGLSLAYGVSFSPDNSKLYFTEYFLTNNINQVNLNAGGGHPDSIRTSKIVVGNGFFVAGLQLAHDGKIYCSQVSMPNLGVINNPDALGLASGFSSTGITFTPGKMCSMGLPDFPDYYFIDTAYVRPAPQPAFHYDNFCFGDTTQFYDSSLYFSECPEFKWTFGDPGSGSSDTSYQENPVHYFSAPGTYTVTLILNDYCDVSVIQKTVNVSDPDPSILTSGAFCSNDAPFILNAATSGGIWQGAGILNTSTGLFDPSSAGAGNHLIIYSLTGTCVKSDSAYLSVLAAPSASISGPVLVCKGDSVTLAAVSGGQQYLWNTGETSSQIKVSPLANTKYYLTVTDTFCSSTDSLLLVVNDKPVADAGAGATITLGSEIILNGSGGSYYLWQPSEGLSCITCQNPIASPSQTTTYILTVTDTNGCMAADTVTIEVITNCSDVFVPNAFSPNGDGWNDVYYIYGKCIKQIVFSVYDRWGEKVFMSNDILEGWDGSYKGSYLNAGVFSYTLVATPVAGEEIVRAGNISLVR